MSPQIPNSLRSLTDITSPFPTQGKETLFSKRSVQAMILLPRRLARLLPTLVTGFTRPGLSPVCSSNEVLYTQTNLFPDLKEFLDTHGIPAPQPYTRDKLIASVRRNSRVASLKSADLQASASASAAAATESLSEQLLNAWSDSRKFVLLTVSLNIRLIAHRN